jgi:hypothetical protein
MTLVDIDRVGAWLDLQGLEPGRAIAAEPLPGAGRTPCSSLAAMTLVGCSGDTSRSDDCHP